MATHANNEKPQPRRIVLFDGVCSVCDHVVHFIIDRDSRQRFEFAAQQSPVGAELAARAGIPDVSTLVLIEDGRAYTESTAALRIARQLDGPYKWLYWLILVPKPLRDTAYRNFAARRYRWFGQLDACRVPPPEMRARFLDLAPVTSAQSMN
jgi:predicted DCC family thiol-disulfide oxidoreductase YuxK